MFTCVDNNWYYAKLYGWLKRRGLVSIDTPRSQPVLWMVGKHTYNGRFRLDSSGTAWYVNEDRSLCCGWNGFNSPVPDTRWVYGQPQDVAFITDPELKTELLKRVLFWIGK